MSKAAFDKIAEGLTEALAIARGAPAMSEMVERVARAIEATDEIKITHEMIEAGTDVLMGSGWIENPSTRAPYIEPVVLDILLAALRAGNFLVREPSE